MNSSLQLDVPAEQNREYVCGLRVVRDGDGCTIEWGSEFTPSGANEDDAEKVIQGIYQAGFDNLKKMFGG